MNSKRNYPLLLVSQFLGAFGDNAILVVILGPLMAKYHAGLISAHEQSIANIYFTSLLFIPFVLLAPMAGFLNDRYPKYRWLLGGNLIKLAGSAMAALSLAHGSAWQTIGYLVVGVGACAYSPAKYGILPEIVPAERLVKANGTVELLTLVAILAGNIAGAAMVDRFPLPVCYGLVIANYAASLFLNLFMTPTPAYPEVKLRGSAREFFVNLRAIFSHPRLSRILMGTVLFWVCGALLKMNFQPFGQQVLKYESVLQVALLGLWLSIGVMIGSVAAGYFYKVGDLRATRRYGWLLAGSVGVLGGVDWLLHHGLSHPSALAITVLIVAGVMAGLFLIPLNAALQAESHNDKLGKTIATQNGVENLAMLGGSVFALVNVQIGFDPSQLFLCLAALLAVIVCALKIPARQPEAAVASAAAAAS